MSFNNYATERIHSIHDVDTELAEACLKSARTTVEDKQDAVRENIAKVILLQAFNERNVEHVYQSMSCVKDRLRLANKAKDLLQNNSYILEITEWYQKKHGITEDLMPTFKAIADTVRREAPEVIQALLETLPPESLLPAPAKEIDEFLEYVEKWELEEFELEAAFEEFLQKKARKKKS